MRRIFGLSELASDAILSAVRMAADNELPPSTAEPQLHGWKDISAYFGRSVRTVQRWERDFGLPIRRYGFGRGEVVHAYVRELDEWRATAEADAARRAAESGGEGNGTAVNGHGLAHGAHDARGGGDPAAQRSVHATDTSTGADLGPEAKGLPSTGWMGLRWRPLTIGLVAAAGLATAVGLAAMAVWGFGTPPGGGDAPGGIGTGTAATATRALSEPADWTASGSTLVVKDVEGRALWTYTFPFVLARDLSGGARKFDPSQWAIDDVDGDGFKELIFRSVAADGNKDHYRFYCFNHDGTLRWSFGYGGSQTYSGAKYGPPYKADRLFVTPRAGPGKDVWLISVQSPWFPSVMSRVKPDGAISAEYWSNGYITLIRRAEIGGRPVLLVAARNDESGGASVAMLDAADPVGAAPAEVPRYQCETCPPGRPIHFVKIPKPARLSSLKGSSPPMVLDVDGNSQVIVRVDHASDVGDAIGGSVVYTFDAQLRPVSVGLGSNFEAACRSVAARGYVPPLPATPVIEEVRTVRWWDGSRFVDLRAPSVSSPEGTTR